METKCTDQETGNRIWSSRPGKKTQNLKTRKINTEHRDQGTTTHRIKRPEIQIQNLDNMKIYT